MSIIGLVTHKDIVAAGWGGLEAGRQVNCPRKGVEICVKPQRSRRDLRSFGVWSKSVKARLSSNS